MARIGMRGTGKRVEPLEVEPSPAMLFPHLRLALAIVERACYDLVHGDPLEKLDSYLFLRSDAPLYLRVAGLDDLDINSWTRKQINKNTKGKRK